MKRDDFFFFVHSDWEAGGGVVSHFVVFVSFLLLVFFLMFTVHGRKWGRLPGRGVGGGLGGLGGVQ